MNLAQAHPRFTWDEPELDRANIDTFIKATLARVAFSFTQPESPTSSHNAFLKEF